MNPNNIKIGDLIEVQQAWEDEAGSYHDEFAKVTDIQEDGELELDFFEAPQLVQNFLKEQTDGYMAKDYKPEDTTKSGGDNKK